MLLLVTILVLTLQIDKLNFYIPQDSATSEKHGPRIQNISSDNIILKKIKREKYDKLNTDILLKH